MSDNAGSGDPIQGQVQQDHPNNPPTPDTIPTIHAADDPTDAVEDTTPEDDNAAADAALTAALASAAAAIPDATPDADAARADDATADDDLKAAIDGATDAADDGPDMIDDGDEAALTAALDAAAAIIPDASPDNAEDAAADDGGKDATDEATDAADVSPNVADTAADAEATAAEPTEATEATEAAATEDAEAAAAEDDAAAIVAAATKAIIDIDDTNAAAAEATADAAVAATVEAAADETATVEAAADETAADEAAADEAAADDAAADDAAADGAVSAAADAVASLEEAAVAAAGLDDVDMDSGLSGLAEALGNLPSEEEMNQLHDLDDGPPQFDPDTLANLAALSRITADEEETDAANLASLGRMHEDGGTHANDLHLDHGIVDDHDYSSLIIPPPPSLTRDQVQELVDNLRAVRDEEDEGELETSANEQDDLEEALTEAHTPAQYTDSMDDGSQRGDGDYEGPKTFQTGKKKRKRNRTVLSCTECHRRKQHCDRNIPCSRCIKRGVPSMCRMETPTVPQRKRKKITDDSPINRELGLRVKALKSLIRSGSNLDDAQADDAARETILQAQRAANSGQPEAVNALAQLSQNALGIPDMSQDAQSSLLLDVLQQLSAASMGRPSSYTNGNDQASMLELRETWSSVAAAQQDSAVQIATAFAADGEESKINVALAGVRDDNGKIFLPPTVRYAEKKLREESLLAHETLPVEGFSSFLESGTRFAYGEDSASFKNKRIAAIQTMSITGGLHMASTFLSRFPVTATQRSVFMPIPTSAEDTAALRDGGLDVKHYRFLDQKSGGVDWDGMREDLQMAAPQSVVLLHISGSVPTGAELAAHQWRLLTTLLQERHLIPLIVMAFQGLSSGDPNRDAQPLRFMVHEGLPVVLVQGFDAMMGLYADSPSILSVATQSSDDRDRIDSQLRSIARSMYYHPPAWGAHLAHTVLSDSKLFPAWLAEIRAISDRLRTVREKLFDLLANKLKTPGSWTHIKRAAGMYCTLLLPTSQVNDLTTKRHVHLLPEGCISLGCLNVAKIDALARAVDYVVREGIREAEEQAAQRLAMELAFQAAKEQQEREEAEAQAAAVAAAAAAAQAEDTLLMEESIASALEAQRAAEEEERRQNDEQRLLEEQVRKAAERAEIARQAELILATI